MGEGGGERVAEKRLTLSEGRAFSARGKELQMSACSVMRHCFIQRARNRQKHHRVLVGSAFYYC